MSVVDNVEWNTYQYLNGEWNVKKHIFPVNMRFGDMVKHLGYTHLLVDEANQNKLIVYRKEKKNELGGSFEYLVVANMFDDHDYFIECPSIIQLLQLLKEFQGYMNLLFSCNTPADEFVEI